MLIHNPDEHHLRAIQEWLIAEATQCGQSFICNWNTISDAFNEGCMLVETEQDKPVSFFTFCSGRRVTEGLVAATVPAWRGRGIGTRMMNAVQTHLYATGAWVIHVECCPSASEKFWRKLGYLDYPPGHWRKAAPNLHLYRSRGVPQTVTTNVSRVDLWFKDMGVPSSDPPNASFSTQHELAIPIDLDWRARVFDRNGNHAEDKIKRLAQRQCFEGGFLVAESADWETADSDGR